MPRRCSCVNALYAFSLLRAAGAPVGAGAVNATIRYVRSHLVTRRYLSGTRYYPAPEAFLYALSRLCATSGHGRYSCLRNSAGRSTGCGAVRRMTR